MKEKVLSMISKAIERSAEQELREWPPKCQTGVWYQPKRPIRADADSKSFPKGKGLNPKA